MACSLRLLTMLALGTTIVAPGCAEGTKVDAAVGSKGTDNAGLGGKTTSAGSGKLTKGGTTGSGGKVSFLTSGGAISTNSPGTSAGASSSWAGSATYVGSGGMPSNGGATAASGGATVLPVAGPADGLGISMKEKQVVEGNTVKAVLLLVNQGTQAIDLLTVKLRYYFTMDTWTTPVLETYYIGPGVANENTKSEFFSIAVPGADRYVETSFIATSAMASPSLNAGSQLEIKTGLHDQSWKTPETSNDYSFTGMLVGFTDRITVYVGGSLVWGVEPGLLPSSGTGGAGGGLGLGGGSGIGGGGVAGAAGSAVAGSSSASGGWNGGTANNGGMANAGAPGVAGAAGSAGLQVFGAAGAR